MGSEPSPDISAVAARWARVAGAFTATAEAVGSDQWSDPAPCEGWVARDVIGHLVMWVPGFLRAGAGVEIEIGIGTGIGIEEDLDRHGGNVESESLVDAWRTLSGAIQALLDAPDAGSRRFEHPRAGSHPLDEAISTFICSDVLIHTWDLATATGQQVTLDPDSVAFYLPQFAAADEEAMVVSGHYGPRVTVPPDADDQTRLIALTGRTPRVPDHGTAPEPERAT